MMTEQLAAAEARKQLAQIKSLTAEIVPEDELLAKLTASILENRPLRVKLGIDPTTRHVHLGHMVTYRLVRTLQDFGHQAVLIIGDYTARIGDPTGKNKERAALSAAQVAENAARYTEQIFKVVDKERAEILWQSSWFDRVDLAGAIGLASRFSVAQLLAHETFRARLENGTRLSLHELFYPILQARDSVEVRADIEVGGMDQKFNILCGRDLLREEGLPPQAALFVPLLPGTDGLKMSKTSGNAVNVLDEPREMYGKIMSLADELLPQYAALTLGPEGSALPVRDDPYRAKRELAAALVELYHSPQESRDATEHFTMVFSRKGMPEKMPEFSLPAAGIALDELLVAGGAAATRSEARRLIGQGAVRLEEERLEDWSAVMGENEKGRRLRVGKRRFLRLV